MTEQDERNIPVVRLMYGGDEAERAQIAPNIVWHDAALNPVSGEYQDSTNIPTCCRRAWPRYRAGILNSGT